MRFGKYLYYDELRNYRIIILKAVKWRTLWNIFIF